jgi:hypothetical protein
MLKKFKLKNVAVIVAFGLFSMGLNASTVTGFTTSHANLKQLVNMTTGASDQINFGVIYIGANTNATVTLDPITANLSYSGTGVQLGGGSSIAKFTFDGSAGAVINLSVSGGNLTSSSSSSIPATYNASVSSVTLDEVGSGSFSVGGVLTLTNNLTPGIYTGYVNVTASY